MSFEDFLIFYAQSFTKYSSEEEMKEVFRLLDDDGDGYVPVPRLKVVFAALKPHSSNQEVILTLFLSLALSLSLYLSLSLSVCLTRVLLLMVAAHTLPLSLCLTHLLCYLLFALSLSLSLSDIANHWHCQTEKSKFSRIRFERQN